MKFLRFILHFLILSPIFCNGQQTLPALPKLELYGVVTVHIKSTPQRERLSVKLTTGHSFPRAKIDFAYDSLDFDRREVYIRNPCRNLSKSYLSISDSTYEVVGNPGDTINVVVTNRDSVKQNQRFVFFEGKNREIQQYYQAKVRLINDPIQAALNEGIAAKTLGPFKEMMDSTYQKLSGFWTDYQAKQGFPDWFRTYEANSLNYSDAWLRVYVIWYQTVVQKKVQEIPASYYAFRKRIRVKNESAVYQYEYLQFLREQLLWQKRQDDNLKSTKLIEYARHELGGNLGNFFEIWERSLSAENSNWVASNFNRQFPAEYQYLIDYIKIQAANTATMLKAGDKAPNFALTDSNDSLVMLSQYKGEIVYLSFWFTTCGPCIKEIPFENKLVEKFKGRPVKVISICTPTPGVADDELLAKWKAAAKRFGLKTIDLFANRSWTKTLAMNYHISAYPHYVLIGADGNIIDNFADRPSQGIDKKIETLLEQTGK